MRHTHCQWPGCNSALSHHNSKYCKEHAQESAREARRAFAERERAKRAVETKRVDASNVRVISDPTGEFVPGCAFDLESFRLTLHAGYWPDGMVVRMRSGGETRRLTVCGAELK